MISSFRRAAVAAVLLIAVPVAALAHTGHGDAGGFAHGFLHPVGGLDHVLAMVAVGLFAAHLGGRALLSVPAAFVAAMALGGALGMGGVGLPFVETLIALSVVVVGLAVALRMSVPTLGAIALVGFFAIFHGHAHGAEMPVDASGARYAAGFLLATAHLHGVGILLVLTVARLGESAGRRAVQIAGGTMALAGVAILAGVA
ncbi:MAG: urease accessory protein [Hyphomicrobiales bacterium]|jgi:urease accessory protein|nr:urease accessory protein [Hyphomicrobiales bacterium]